MRLIAALALWAFLPSLAPAEQWKTLAPGMELGEFPANPDESDQHSRIIVLRIQPELWDLEFIGISSTDEPEGRTAKEWGRKYGLAAVINAGMYAEDYRTHIGYLQYREKVHSKKVNLYQSVAAFHPLKKSLPAFRIFDLDSANTSMDEILSGYASAVQNLRLIKRPGENRWQQQERKWSEAALGEDSSGRILFIFYRDPISMHDFNRILLSLKIDIVAAQHLEGGPEAQLYINVADVEMEMSGTYEAFFREKEKQTFAMPVPNVLGVRSRATKE